MPHLTENLMADGDIMIVDDNPANLKLLEDMLLQQGHEVRSFPLGRLALAAAVKYRPDLILLDINMPEMDGYEVCENLKASTELAGIPVIFLSALNETQDKVKAFRSGAVDYISKPFQFEEVHARVETHLQLRHLQQALERQNEHLEKRVADRTSELAAANQRLTILDRSKNDFLDLISHEFRTPLNGILGVGELLLDEMITNEENRPLRGLFERSRRRILSLLEDALLLTQIDVSSERYTSAAVPLSEVLCLAIQSATELAEARRVTIVAPSPDLSYVIGNKALLVRAFGSLLETAVKFSEKGESSRITYEDSSSSRTIAIESVGRTVPDDALAKFFEPFSIGEAITPGGDLGLGPSLALRILLLFGGSVTVVNKVPAGVRLTISLREASRDGMAL